jgi:hypothetical protein
VTFAAAVSHGRREPDAFQVIEAAITWGAQMSFGRMISLVITIVAVLAVFVEIPVVSDYAFWILMVALLIWMGVHRLNPKNRFRLWVMVTYGRPSRVGAMSLEGRSLRSGRLCNDTH